MSMSKGSRGRPKAHARGSVWSGAISLVLALLAMLSAETAVAQTSTPGTDREEEARAHFRLSQSHYELGHFAEAAAELEQAYALSPRPDLLYNLYVARRDAGQLAAAASALRQYLAEGEHIENAALLRHRLAALEAQLAGERASESEQATESAPEGSASVPPADASGAEEPSSEASGATIGAETVAARPLRESSRSPSPVGYAVLGVGAAMLVAGLVTGGLALDRYGALEATCGGDHGCPAGIEGAREEGLALATSTDVLLVGGGVITAVGVVLLFTVLDETPSPPVSASCDAEGCHASASLSF